MKSLLLLKPQIILIALSLMLVACQPTQAQFASNSNREEAEEHRLRELQMQVQNLLTEQQQVIKQKEQLERELKNTSLKVFHLKHIPAIDAADHLHFVLGKNLGRVSHDEKRNLLLLAAKPEITNRVGDLLQTLDIPAPAPRNATSTKELSLPDSLMVRIFWLSDGSVHDEAQPAELYVPSSVLAALDKVGIHDPYIVLQSNTAVAFAGDENGRATTLVVDDLPAIVFGERLPFHAQGKIHSTNKGHLSIEMQIHTVRQISPLGLGGSVEYHNEGHIQGSMVAPLNHYLVLGTTNYASVVDKGKYDTTRFAYVLQIVEANTYAPE